MASQVFTQPDEIDPAGLDVFEEADDPELFDDFNPDHYANLAGDIDESTLNRMAVDIIEWVESDKLSRRDWEEREAKGIRMLGVSNKTDGGASFKGASRVVHPLLAEACVQFNARAMGELWPPEGPVKTQVLGEQTRERSMQAERVKNFCNYQYSTLMPDAYDDHDKMLFRLPLSGSCFKQIEFDHLEQMPISRFIEPSRMHVPYTASSLRTAHRYTYEFYESENNTRIKVRDGVYVDAGLSEPLGRDVTQSDTEEEIDSSEGRTSNDREGDEDYTRYECHCLLDLKGFEDPDGIELPYVVVVDEDNQKVLSIKRNWRESDPLKKKVVRFAHYKFLQGLGFYGFGFIHAIGGLASAATGALRSFMDSAMLANMGGGFRSRQTRLTGGDKEVKLGVWNEVNASPDELSKAFVPFPNKGTEKTLIELLGYVTEIGQRFASTTDNVVGDANNNAPVGTTLALIEQGLKVFSGIHLRIHTAQAEEFSILVQVNADTLPQAYPYDVPNESRGVFRADFDDRVDVIPVSDPNIVSSTQRIALGQSVLQLVDSAPDVYGEEGRRKAHRQMLIALRAPNVDELVPEEKEAVPKMDPVNENVSIMEGKPVMVYPDQHHQAHYAVHMAVREFLPTEEAKGALDAHNASHMGHLYRIQIEQQLGQQLPAQEYPPEIEAQIAEAVAMRTNVQLPTAAPEQQGPDPKDLEAAAGINRKDLEAAAGIERKDREVAAKIDRELAGDMAEAGRQAAAAMQGLDVIQ